MVGVYLCCLSFAGQLIRIYLFTVTTYVFTYMTTYSFVYIGFLVFSYLQPGT